MELRDALRTTPAVRSYTERQIDDATIAAILDDARFAPSGGNRQAWRVVVLKDPTTRRAVRDLYLEGIRLYVAQAARGLVPFNPFNDRALETAAGEAAAAVPDEDNPLLDRFSLHLDEAPALLLVLADLSALATVDRDHGRYTFAGGASVYPFAWNILLAARERGLGGVMTTMAIFRERQVLELIGAPEHFAVATLLALGEPRRQITKLRRGEVAGFCTIDAFDGPALASPA